MILPPDTEARLWQLGNVFSIVLIRSRVHDIEQLLQPGVTA